MFFSVITKNGHWEILTTNLVTFKDEVKDEKHYFFGGEGGEGSLKNPIFKGGGYNYLKRGSLAVYKFKVGGTWPEKGGGVFLGG